MTKQEILGVWKHAKSYGVEKSYQLGACWLDDCKTVEDWGAGGQAAKSYIKGEYTAIDGSPPADIICDLRERKSSPEGIFMRHVLEHNYDWDVVLKSALESFTKKMSLIMFRGDAETTKLVHTMSGNEEIPFLQFTEKDIVDYIGPYLVSTERVPRPDKKSMHDTIYYLKK